MDIEKLLTHIKNILVIILKYLKYSVIDGIIIGVVNFIFMYFMEMPLKLPISILMAVTNLVPNFGPIVGAVIGGIVLAISDVKLALWFLGFTVILQTIDGLFIKPKLFGDSFGISGVIMLIAMIIGGGLFGILGMIFVVPAVAIARYLIKDVLMSDKKE